MECSLVQEFSQPETVSCQLNTLQYSLLQNTLSYQDFNDLLIIDSWSIDQDDSVNGAVINETDVVSEEILMPSEPSPQNLNNDSIDQDCVIDAVINKADRVYEEIDIISDDEADNIHSIPDINHRKVICPDDPFELSVEIICAKSSVYPADCMDAVISKVDRVHEEIAVLSDDQRDSIPDINYRKIICYDNPFELSDKKIHKPSAVCTTKRMDVMEGSSTNPANNKCFVNYGQDQCCHYVQFTTSKKRFIPKILKAFKFAAEDCANCLRNLVANGFNLNCRNNKRQSLLMVACLNGSISVVRFLLSQNVGLNKRDKNKNTAEDLALKQGHNNIVKILKHHTIVSLKKSYSQIFKKSVPQSIKTKHEPSIIQQSKITRPKVQNYIYLDTSNINSQTLPNCGWNGQNGFGKHKQGNNFPISTETKIDQLDHGQEGDKIIEKVSSPNNRRKSKKNEYCDFYCRLCAKIVWGVVKIHNKSVVHKTKQCANSIAFVREQKTESTTPNNISAIEQQKISQGSSHQNGNKVYCELCDKYIDNVKRHRRKATHIKHKQYRITGILSPNQN